MFLFFNFYSSEETICDPWPKNLPTIRDCCNIPNYLDEHKEKKCLRKCADEECFLKCYIKEAYLVENGTVNTDNAYREYLIPYNIEHERKFGTWLDFTRKAAEKCKFDSSGTLKQNFVKFYDCINDNIANNCMDIIQSLECEASVEHYELCKINCSSIQTWTECCDDIPALYTEQVKDKCFSKAYDCVPAFPEAKFNCYMKQSHKCIYESTKHQSQDIEHLMNFLEKSSKNTSKWRDPIKKIADDCGSKVKGYHHKKFS